MASETPRPQRLSALVISFLWFVAIVFGVWVVSAGKRYRDEYAQASEGWRVGTTQMVELTLVATDAQNLACASGATVGGLKCGYGPDGQATAQGQGNDAQILQPYNTTGRQLLLGAGLWQSPDFKGPLPAGRFSVVCNYHIQGVMKSVAIRFAPSAAFAPLRTTVTAGTLTDCVLPQ